MTTVSASASSAGIKKALHLGGTLFLVTAATGLILGAVENVTRQAILRTQEAAKAEALQQVMPDASSFRPVELGSTSVGDVGITEVQEAVGAGWCVSVTSKGYGGPVGIVVGIGEDGTVRGVRILSQSETPGLGAKSTDPAFYGQFDGRSSLPLKAVKGAPSAPDEIAAISGATITSNAVVSGVNAAVSYWDTELKGGAR